MAEEETPKLHIDSDWKAEAQKEKERLVAAEEARKTPDAPGAADRPGLPAPSFAALITMLAQQALMGLGTEDPQSKTPSTMTESTPLTRNASISRCREFHPTPVWSPIRKFFDA